MRSKQTILIVDDCADNIDILKHLLSRYELLVAQDGGSALQLLQQQEVDLVLLDIIMPGMNGFETCQQIKQLDNHKNTPIIFITSKSDEASIELGFEHGGMDYITKPFNPKELLARVRTQLRVQNLIKKLIKQAFYDSLTNIFNRRKFFELGEQIFESGSEEVVAYILDIDNFKRINDNFGHHLGDKVIKLTAQTINNHIPDSCVLARLGGEEFGIVGNSMPWDDACELAETLRRKIEEIEIYTDDQQKLHISISIGLSSKNESHETLDMLLASADALLYEAKGAGRNRAVCRKLSRKD